MTIFEEKKWAIATNLLFSTLGHNGMVWEFVGLTMQCTHDVWRYQTIAIANALEPWTAFALSIALKWADTVLSVQHYVLK